MFTYLTETDENVETVETNPTDDVNIPYGGEGSSTVPSDTDCKSKKCLEIDKKTMNENKHFSSFSVNPFQYFEHQLSSDDEVDEIDELEMSGDQVFVIDESHRNANDPYPTTEKKKEILKRFDSLRSPKTLKKLQNYYKELSSLSTVYDWRKKFNENGNTNLAIRFF